MKLSIAMVCAALVGCGGGDSNVELSLTGQTLGDNARAIVSLYGYNTSVADEAATLIESYDLPAAATLDLEIPANPHELIDSAHGPTTASEAKYYFAVYVDVNADGQLCPGDLREDFGADLVTFTTPPSALSVPMTPIATNTPCRSAAP